jgi:antitoxin ParD1/3/4
MAEIERQSAVSPRRQLRERDVAVLRSRWDKGKASGRAGRLDVKRVLAEEQATFKRRTRRRD